MPYHPDTWLDAPDGAACDTETIECESYRTLYPRSARPSTTPVSNPYQPFLQDRGLLGDPDLRWTVTHSPRWIDVSFACAWLFASLFLLYPIALLAACVLSVAPQVDWLFTLVPLSALLAGFFSTGLLRHHHSGVWDTPFLYGTGWLLVGVGAACLALTSAYLVEIALLVLHTLLTGVVVLGLGFLLCAAGAALLKTGWNRMHEAPALCPSCSTLTHMAQRGQVRGWWQCDQPGCLHFSTASCAVCHRQAIRTYLDTPICANSACTHDVWEQHRNWERYRNWE